MAPGVPAEIDVFVRPHARMKELVNRFTKKMLNSDLGHTSTVVSLVAELRSTLLEFRRHEAIENVLILDRLKQRMQQHRKRAPPHLCSCHEDDALPKLFEFVRWCERVLDDTGDEEPADLGHTHVGSRLHSAYTRFLQHFLPHMKLEEQEFQPLLMTHFEYNELIALQDEVWQQHRLYAEQHQEWWHGMHQVQQQNPYQEQLHSEPVSSFYNYLNLGPEIGFPNSGKKMSANLANSGASRDKSSAPGSTYPILNYTPPHVEPPFLLNVPSYVSSRTPDFSRISSTSSISDEGVSHPDKNGVTATSGIEIYPGNGAHSSANESDDFNRMGEQYQAWEGERQMENTQTVGNNSANCQLECETNGIQYENLGTGLSTYSSEEELRLVTQQSDVEHRTNHLVYNFERFLLTHSIESLDLDDAAKSLTKDAKELYNRRKASPEQLEENSYYLQASDPFLFSSLTYETETLSVYSDGRDRIKQSSITECVRSEHTAFEAVALTNLPHEILLKICSYLSPRDLLRLGTVSSRFNGVVTDQSLWKHLYPAQWAKGLWTWCDLRLGEVHEDAVLSFGDLWPRPILDEDADDDDTSPAKANEGTLRLRTILLGLAASVGRWAGHAVETIVLDGGGHVCSRSLNKLLSCCPNIVHLSAAYTSVDYLLFKGLWKHNRLKRLKILDLCGCERIDDAAMNCLAICNEPVSGGEEHSDDVFNADASDVDEDPDENYVADRWKYHPSIKKTMCMPSYTSTVIVPNYSFQPPTPGERGTLEVLNLSGCHLITSYGIDILNKSRLLHNLRQLDLSGCSMIRCSSINSLVENCPHLRWENTAFCDNIVGISGAVAANGCGNLGHPLRRCCRPGI